MASTPLGEKTNTQCRAGNSEEPKATTVSMMAEIMRFDTELRKIIPPKTQSDRTGFHNIAQWLADQVRLGVWTRDIFDRVLGYAKEAAGPACHNPAAVFITILKKELGYGRKGQL